MRARRDPAVRRADARPCAGPFTKDPGRRADPEVPLGRSEGRQVGALLGVAGRSDVIGASVVDAARDGSEILTSDPADLAALAAAAGKTLIISRV